MLVIKGTVVGILQVMPLPAGTSPTKQAKERTCSDLVLLFSLAPLLQVMHVVP